MFISSSQRVWSLLNKEDQTQYDGLSFSEARAIIMTLKPEERLNWYGFKMGWYDWKPLKDCMELITFSRMSRTKLDYVPPPFPDAKEPRVISFDQEPILECQFKH